MEIFTKKCNGYAKKMYLCKKSDYLLIDENNISDISF
jgi:hypothetical protein